MASPRTQAQRTATTRAALVDAAIDLLDEVGWAGTTSVAVCERAGLTRGALVHHFGDLPTLLAEALDGHYDRLASDAAIRRRPTTMLEAIDRTWRAVDEGRFKVVIEAWLAAANDPALGPAIAPVIARFAKLVDPADLLPTELAESDLYLIAREAMLGLALGRATTGGPLPHEDTVLDGLRRQAAAYDSGPPAR
ncbi:MAG: TetR/AcrR family transcriptional regulator [Actinomycetota bacterium]